MEQVPLIATKVLIVDDREENIHSLQNLLEQEGQEIHFFHAISGNDALKIAFREELALIFLDVQMPGMDGYEVASILKQKKSTQNIPVIFVTALNQESKYVAEGYSKGAIDYLFKPLDPIITRAKFNSFINIYLQQKKLENAYKDLELIVKDRTADLQSKNEELLQAQNELLVNNKKLVKLNNELDQFVYIASHDLKLPLANLEGLLEAIKDDIEHFPDESEEIFNMMGNSVVQMKNTINGLIDIIQSQQEEEEHMELINCRQVLNEIEISISNLIQDSYTEIRVEMDDCQDFKFNRVAFKSVLYNLVTNSIKYRHPERKPVIDIIFKENENDFCLRVIDNGIGMTAPERMKLFKLFSRLEYASNTEGTGMGLYNLRNLLARYEATIDVQSEKGKGSEFVVVFEKQRKATEV